MSECRAHENDANLPDEDPAHVCVLPDGHFPATDHEDYSGFRWHNPEPKHEWVIS